MADWQPLNPELYAILQRYFGTVKVDKRGQKMQILPATVVAGERIAYSGETYRVNCPWCNHDTKFHLHVNYTFGMANPETGKTMYIATCYKHGKVTDLIRPLLRGGIKPQLAPVASESEVIEEPYVLPGICVGFDQPDPRLDQARAYLLDRGIDPVRATRLYGVCLCVEGNIDVYGGAMAGRIIFPVTRRGYHVGWQARLAFKPSVFLADSEFKYLRWISMPGMGWRASNLIGLDQAAKQPFGVVVEGPTDMVRHGPPLVGSLGQVLSPMQVDLIAETWGNRSAIFVVGDSMEKSNGRGEEEKVSAKNAELIKQRVTCPVFRPRLPHGDPGSWETKEFFKFLQDHVRENPKGYSPSAAAEFNRFM